METIGLKEDSLNPESLSSDTAFSNYFELKVSYSITFEAIFRSDQTTPPKYSPSAHMQL